MRNGKAIAPSARCRSARRAAAQKDAPETGGPTTAARKSRLFAAALVVVALLGQSCTDGRVGNPVVEAGPCQRRPLPGFLVGANVVDLADDADADPGNDGRRGYGSDRARATLRHLASLGAGGVVLPVVVRAASLTSTEVQPGPLGAPGGRARLARMIDDAHALGLAVVVVPHLQLSDGGWRGDLAPRLPGDDDEAAKRAFLSDYARAIAPFVEVAEDRCAEAFSVGVELKSLSRDEGAPARFAPLVSSVRARFSGALTYSANWDEVFDARVWPLFDRIGVNAFFPLADEPGADDAALSARAEDVVRRLDALAAREGRPVWLVEAGFKAVAGSFVEPWKWPGEIAAETLPVDEAAQARAYRALAGAVSSSKSVDGVFFWVVPADPEDAAHPWRFEPPQGFNFVGKQAEAVVRDLAARPGAR